MVLFAATLFAASTQGSTPASLLNCIHVRTNSNDIYDILCDRLGHAAVAAGCCNCYITVTSLLQDVCTDTSLLQDVTGCCHYERKGEADFELSSHTL